MAEVVESQAVELVTFTSSGDAYVYAPLPPATSYGHRAELWNPDKWLQEVKLKVITAGDACFVRMFTKDNGELFAECPLPFDGTPLTTAVEPVVDSSRYFVVKVVDRESRNHAFVGVGFRNRDDASDFTAALDDYRQYLRRQREAQQLRQEFSKLQGSEAAAGPAEAGEAAQQQHVKDFSLKPGQTIHINLSGSLKRATSGKSSTSAGSQHTEAVGSSSNPSSSASNGGAERSPAGGLPRLAPPASSSGFFRLQPPPPSGSGAAVTGAPAAAATGAAGQPEGAVPVIAPPAASSSAAANDVARGQASNVASGPQKWPSGGAGELAASAQAAGSAAAAAVAQHSTADAAVEEDDWGDFIS